VSAKLISSHIGSEGEVVALTEKGCYVYGKPLDEEKSKKLLDKLKDAKEINVEHWTLEWEFSSTGTGVIKA